MSIEKGPLHEELTGLLQDYCLLEVVDEPLPYPTPEQPAEKELFLAGLAIVRRVKGNTLEPSVAISQIRSLYGQFLGSQTEDYPSLYDQNYLCGILESYVWRFFAANLQPYIKKNPMVSDVFHYASVSAAFAIINAETERERRTYENVQVVFIMLTNAGYPDLANKAILGVFNDVIITDNPEDHKRMMDLVNKDIDPRISKPPDSSLN